MMYSGRRLNKTKLGKTELGMLLCTMAMVLMTVFVLQNRVSYPNISINAMLKINRTLINLDSELVQPSLNLQSDSKASLANSSDSRPITSPSGSVFKITPSLKNGKAGSLNIMKIERRPHDFKKGVIRVKDKNITIFVHGLKDRISRAILNNGWWENNWIMQLLLFLDDFRRPRIIDLGCNIGVYSLVGAYFGHRVVAVDANRNHTDRLVQSVIENHLETKVMVILNAVSNTRKNFSVDMVNDNVGRQRLIHKKLASYQVSSILLDDLLPVVKENEDVIIKVDVEGSEVDIFNEDSEFFSKRNVVAVQMEWLVVKQTKDCHDVISFFISRKYMPYENFFTGKQLEVTKYYLWPWEIVWRKIG